MNKVNRLTAYLLGIDLIFITNAIIKGLLIGKIEIDFGEGSLITILSVLKLIIISIGCLWVYRIKSSNKFILGNIFQPGYSFWLILSLGFLFLALDDLLGIHEKVDYLIHSVLFNWHGFKENGFSDRIDDILVLMYLFIGIYFIIKSKREVSKFYLSKGYVIIGLYLTAFMVGLDIISNRSDLLNLILPYSLAKIFTKILLIIEESFKIFASTFFLSATYKCTIIAKNLK